MALRYKLDEILRRRVEPALRALGNDVETAVSEGLAGCADPNLLAASGTEDRILVTPDLDFADIGVYPTGSHRGIRVLRPANQTFDTILNLVQAGLRLAVIERTAGQLWVVDEKRVRIRD